MNETRCLSPLWKKGIIHHHHYQHSYVNSNNKGAMPEFIITMANSLSGYKWIVNDIGARLTGPLSLRFVVQPLIAIFLGLRDGRMDARAGIEPFSADFVKHPEHRKDLFKKAISTIVIPIIIGIILDSIAQHLIFNMIHPLQAVIVGSFVIAVPYLLSRGLSNRFISRKKRH